MNEDDKFFNIKNNLNQVNNESSATGNKGQYFGQLIKYYLFENKAVNERKTSANQLSNNNLLKFDTNKINNNNLSNINSKNNFNSEYNNLTSSNRNNFYFEFDSKKISEEIPTHKLTFDGSNVNHNNYNNNFTSNHLSRYTTQSSYSNNDFLKSKKSKKREMLDYISEEISNSKFLNNNFFKANPYLEAVPQKILDAPYMVDDISYNLLDWSSSNILAVALMDSVYLWNGNNNETNLLIKKHLEICSVKWMNKSNVLAIGFSSGKIELVDADNHTPLRILHGHKNNSKVNSLAWNDLLLASAGSDGRILIHDVKNKNHVLLSLYTGINSEVTNIQWNPFDKHCIASCTKEGSIIIWDTNYTTDLNSLNYGNSTNYTNFILEDIEYYYKLVLPKIAFNKLQANLRAISFCPWEKNVLVSGGTDKTLRVWNTEKGIILKELKLNSAIFTINWNIFGKEIITTHGQPEFEMSIRKFPELNKLIDLTSHSMRALYTSISPDGTTIVTAAADERLVFWNIFTPETQNMNSTVNFKPHNLIM